MASYTTRRPAVGAKDYPTKIDGLIDDLETDISALENAGYTATQSYTLGNISEFDTNGDLVDSGIATSDIPTMSAALSNGNYVMASAAGTIEDSGVSVSTPTASWESTLQNLPFSTGVILGTYSATVIPKATTVWVQCKVANNGWAIGERVSVPSNYYYLWFNTTSSTFKYYPIPGTVIQIPEYSSVTTIEHIATAANWGLIIGATL